MLRPVPRRSLSDAVFRQLRDEIVSGGLAPGRPLPAERELCERLGVNRGAVREALRRLEQARLVSVRHGGTSRVLDYRASAGLDLLSDLITGPDGALDPDAIRGVMEVRSAVAPDVARLAALRGGAERAAALDAVVDAMLAAGGDPVRLQHLAVAFWAELIEASQNLAYRLLWNTLRHTYEQSLPLLTRVLAAENGDVAAHASIAAAVRKRDPKSAYSRAHALVQVGEEAVLAALAVLAESEKENRR